MARPIQVEVDVKSAAAIGAFAGLGASIAQAGIQLVQAGITAGIEAIGNSIELASDKAESASKVNVLFADSADAIHTASQNAATSVGLSSGAYLAAAGNLGNLLKNFDLSTGAAADMSQGMIQLAADVGSFNNADPSEVIEAMGAALRGESEPMRRFGVLIDEAAIKAKGMELGLSDASGALDKAGRAQAIYALMLEQTTDAQGDFARTSDGLANQQRINAARLEDAWTRLGEKLKPIAEAILPMIADALIGLVDLVNDVAEAIGEWVEDNQELVDTLVNIGRTILNALQLAFGWLIDIVGELGYRLGGLIGLFIDLGGALIDLGAGIVAILRGDFESAANHGQLLVERLGSFGENVLRTLGDTGQRVRDETERNADAAAEAAIEASDAAEARIQQAWTRSAAQASTGAADIGMGAAAGLSSALDAGVPKVGRSAENLASTVPDALRKGKQEAGTIAAETPGALAAGLRERRSTWQDALRTLGDDLKNAMSVAQERAEIEAALAGKRLARGLASTDPIVRAQAEQTRAILEGRLAELGDQAFDWGSKVGKGLTKGLHSQDAYVRGWAQQAARAIADRLKVSSPAKTGPWSEDGGPIAWFESMGRRMFRALDSNLNAAGVRVPRLQLSGAGPGPGGSINVYITAGVGDPVAIGREVSEALRAYQRASGTE